MSILMLMKMRSRMKRTNNQKGFTLVELMVVVVIIGILVAIAVQVYRNVQNNAAENAHNANVRTLQGVAASCVTTEGVPSAAVTWNSTTGQATATHAWGNYVDEWPTNPLPATHANAGTYSVTISTAGAITVSPAKI